MTIPTSATFCLRFNSWSNSEERSSFYTSPEKRTPNKNRLLIHNINLLGLSLLHLTLETNVYLQIDIGHATIERSLVLRFLLVDTRTNRLNSRLTSFA